MSDATTTAATTPSRPATAAGDAWPALMPTDVAAAYCGSSEPAWRRADKAGRVPAPVFFGSRLRWRRADLDDWIAAGCPPRDAATAERHAVELRRHVNALAATKRKANAAPAKLNTTGPERDRTARRPGGAAAPP